MMVLALLLSLQIQGHAQSFDSLRAFETGSLLLPAAPAAPAPAWMSPVYAKADGAELSEGQLAARLLNTRLIYVGEQHNQASNHLIEAEVVREMARVHSDLAVGLEMVDRSQQKSLDDYVSGAMSEADFAAFWKKAWGFDYALYQPVLALCRARHIPLIALNVPHDVVHQVAVGGLASLTPDQRKWLPAKVNPIPAGPYLDAVKGEIAGHGPMPSGAVDRYLEAMALWNEGMGAAAADSVKSGRMMVVLAGAMHVMLGSGILTSVRSRSGLTQAVVLPYPMDGQPKPRADLLKELRDPDTAALADYFWLLQK